MAGLIAPGALEGALPNGRPGFAAADVYQEEPVLGATHPPPPARQRHLHPHLGHVERDNYALYFGQAFDPIYDFLAQGLH